jgi:hypothetical protein
VAARAKPRPAVNVTTMRAAPLKESSATETALPSRVLK